MTGKILLIAKRLLYWEVQDHNIKINIVRMKVEAYPMPDKVKVTIITKISLRCHTGLKRLLNAFESVERFTPTHWGLDERAPNPYNHDELIAAVSTLKSNFYLPGLHRRQAPRYQAYFSAHAPTMRSQAQTYQMAYRLHKGERLFEDG